MALFKYACQALVIELGGRCRLFWDGQPGAKVCAVHRRSGYELVTGKMWQLLRFTLNDVLLEEAHDVGGFPWWKDAIHPVARQAYRQREAEELGRKFAAYRPKGDTGSLVFQPKLGMADISMLPAQLEAAGYVLARQDIKPVEKDDEVVGGKFTQAYIKAEALESEPLVLTKNQESWLKRRIFGTPWDVYIYDNPISLDPDKDPTDTANFNRPAFGQQPKSKLDYAMALWEAEELLRKAA